MYTVDVSGQSESECENIAMQSEPIRIGAKPSSALATPDPASDCCLEGFRMRGAGLDVDAAHSALASAPRSVFND